MNSEHEDSILNAQDQPDYSKTLTPVQAQSKLRQLLQRIDHDLTEQEKKERLEDLMAEYGEIWFS